MTTLSRELLERAPEESARRLALSYVDAADEALGRFEDPEDAESLHDFRVALRRLRSCLRAYRPYVKGSISKKLRSRLRELARSTNEARDLEVLLAWLQTQDSLSAEERAGVEWLKEELRSRLARHAKGELDRVRQTYHELRGELVKRLAVCEIRLERRPEGIPSFVTATGALLRRQGQALLSALQEIRGVTDDLPVHEARIQAKRLRYLLEPLRKEVSAARPLVAQLKELQDLLGMLHDSTVMMEEVSTAFEKNAVAQAHRLKTAVLDSERATAEPPAAQLDPIPGLLALLKALKARRELLDGQVRSAWMEDRAAGFFRKVEKLGRALSLTRDAELRRRFVLEALPERFRKSAGSIVDEGWLPGKLIHELVKRTRSGRRTVYERVIERPGYPALVERLSKTDFEKLWSLTSPRRVRRRRYEVLEDDAGWLIDEIEAPHVVLAEAAGFEPGDDLRLPAWVQPYVVKEVTGDRRYRSDALAAEAARRLGKRGS